MLLRLEQVLERVALGKTQLYALMREGKFPRPAHLGQRCNRWHAGDVLAWIDEKRTTGSDRLGVPTVPARGHATEVEE